MMLGKTNITTLAEGAIVTEIEDFHWVRMQTGINGNFKKAIHENGYLAAITADGKVVYTTDGETWQVSKLKYADCKLEDIAWDGSRFLLAGNYTDTIERTDGTSGEYELGFISLTADFVSYEYFGADISGIRAEKSYDYYSNYLAVYPTNGKWIVLAKNMWHGNSASVPTTNLNMLVGGIESSLTKDNNIVNSNYMGEICIGKNSQGILVTSVYGTKGKTYLINGNALKTIKSSDLSSGSSLIPLVKLPVFECKDELYYTAINNSLEYRFVKVLSSGEEMIMSTGINYGFIGGVYFNGCQLFINEHEMLILKKGESITDKTQENLLEIAPENTMTCITKAFGQLFVFGNQGLIFKSSTEGKSEEAILIQTISAKKALLEANAYTEQCYKLLEARIAALEVDKESSTTI